jgi:hypothetical protein
MLGVAVNLVVATNPLSNTQYLKQQAPTTTPIDVFKIEI